MTQPDHDLALFSDPLDPEQLDLRTPIADAAEQASPVDDSVVRGALQLPFEANEYDVLEQAHVVPVTEDDYR
ncbi:MAG TPA: hypothetical protein VK453_12310 [Micromonosporaceae bacterium]|nr:hypothetical protein [Micromonosporaceae bacterium]